MMEQLKMQIRHWKRQPLQTTILLGGLTISMATCLLIALFISNELNYDKFNTRINRIALLQQYEGTLNSGGQLATDIGMRFAGVEKTARLLQSKLLFRTTTHAAYESKVHLADATIDDVLSFSSISGNLKETLLQMNGLALSASAANRYFGKENPIGKELTIGNNMRFVVGAVFQDLPANSHLQSDALVSFKSANDIMGYDVTTNYWGGNVHTYLLLKAGQSIDGIAKQLPDYITSLNDNNASAVWKPNLIPLKDVYLRTSLIANSPISYVYLFTVIGVMILLLAAFNYINLSTARASMRNKEVAMYKLLGSPVSRLQLRFIAEAAWLIGIAMVLAILLSQFALPMIKGWLGWELSISSLLQPSWLIGALFFIICFVLISGAYPAFILSKGRPVQLLKGNHQGKQQAPWLRRGIVVFQFVVSAGIMVGTLAVYKQLEFIRNKNLGYSRSQVLTLDLGDANEQQKNLIKEKIKALPGIQSATIAFSLPGSSVLQGQKLISSLVPPNSENASIQVITVDQDYLKTFDIALLDGRMLSESRISDRENFLINEAALQKFGWKNIEGKKAGYYTYQYNADGSYNEVPLEGEVVGVISNYHHADLKQNIEPLLIKLNEGYASSMGIKINAGALSAALPGIESIWKQVLPEKPFTYTFLDDSFNKTYEQEQKIGQLFSAFAAVALLISCMGLFGLIAFAIERRQKELSIRKVLGASLANLSLLLSKEFLLLATLACIIAFPIALWGVRVWLQGYAYHIEPGILLITLPAMLLLALVVVTIGGQIWRAAIRNPVHSLRNE